MVFLFLSPAILSFLMLAAHFFRQADPLLTLLCLTLCFLLILPQRWVARLAQVTLILGSIVWIYTTLSLVQMRNFEGKPSLRAAIILLSVAAFSLFAASIFQTRRLKTRFAPSAPTASSPSSPDTPT